jgi:polar amino acid transport system substrate-binding protein
MSTKKFFLIAVVLVIAALIVVGCINTTPAAATPEKRVAIVSGHDDWPPVMYEVVNSDGSASIAGTGVDATRIVFKNIGVDIDPKYVGSWTTVQQMAKEGKIDVIVALYKTKEREEYLYYSIPYTNDPIVLFFKKGHEFNYTGKESLIGKKGVATAGDSYGQVMDDFIVSANLNVVRVNTSLQAFDMLREGKVNYYINSQSAGRSVINQSGLSGFTESGVVSNELFYMGISKKSPFAANMREINSVLRDMIANNQIPGK